MTESHFTHRPIRSFVRREGRITRAQTRALQTLWVSYGLDPGDQLIEFDQVFDRRGAVTLEIGFGNGEALVEMAQAGSDRNYLGVDVYRPGIGAALLRVARAGVENVRLVEGDGVALLQNNIPPASLDGVLIYFPDPWPKKRHHKRRLIQPAFLELLATRLRPGGGLHVATDWEDYARHCLEVLTDASGFHNAVGPGEFVPRPDGRPLTRFEQRGQKLGHGVWDIMFLRND